MSILNSENRLWEKIRSKQGPDLAVFQARFDWLVNPRNGKTLKALILESADWVNVVALTTEKKLVVVKQYRFGIAKHSLEVPAGLVDTGETPQQAAARELAEETGYTAREWKPLGWSYANPAFLTNRAHHFLALDARRTCDPHPEDGEDLAVGEITREEAKHEIAAGRMRNAMTLVALSKVFDMRETKVDKVKDDRGLGE